MESTPSAPAAAGATAAAPKMSQEEIDNKIISDLNVVMQKMDVLDSMLKSPSRQSATGDTLSLSKNDDALLNVVGYLEACAPRMIELVEAAAQGALSEHALMQCLEVNDRLTKLLGDIDSAEWVASVAAAGPPAAPMSDSLLSVDYSTSVPNINAAPAAASTSTIQTTKSEDEFDDFFNERQAGTKTEE